MHRNKSPSFKDRDKQFRSTCKIALDIIAKEGSVTTIRLEEVAAVKRTYSRRVLHHLRVTNQVSATKANGSVPIQYMKYDPDLNRDTSKSQGTIHSKWLDEVSDQVRPEHDVTPTHCEIHQAFFHGRHP